MVSASADIRASAKLRTISRTTEVAPEICGHGVWQLVVGEPQVGSQQDGAVVVGFGAPTLVVRSRAPPGFGASWPPGQRWLSPPWPSASG
jgi:hypothetical protein